MRDAAAAHNESLFIDRTAYRPDIDGLRAVAVLSVIAFHAGLAGVPGGFVGVDVFFVISGYLIGGKVFTEARNRDFSFSAFYARRARRILPALVVLLATLFLIGAVLMTPSELRELGKESFATIFGMSNVLFYISSDYFAPQSDYNPLLMTWSLGVEEQFYLVFPVIVLLATRIPKISALTIFALLSVVSFAGSIFLMDRDLSATFYLLPTRAWELGLGALLALWEWHRPSHTIPARAKSAAAILGLLLIAGAVLLFKPDTPFPGFYALLPTAGAVILIASGGSVFNKAVLANTPMRVIGKLSYSWYLWHWPLFFIDRILGGTGERSNPLLLMMVSFVFAALSWRFVEQPFRRRRMPQRTALAAYAITVVAVACGALWVYRAGGLPQRFSPKAQAFAATAETARADACLAREGNASPNLDADCVSAAPPGRVSLAVLGDSHAASLAPGFRQAAADAGAGFAVFTKSSCPFLIGFAPDGEEARKRSECRRFQDQVFNYVIRHPEIRTVVLAGYWGAEVTVRGGAAGNGPQMPLHVALDQTVSKLEAQGRRVVLVQDVPTFRFDPYARALGDLIPARAALSKLVHGERTETFLARPADILPDSGRAQITAVAAARPEATVIDPVANLCSNGACRYRTDDELYYFDFQHLTAKGAAKAIGGYKPPPA